MRAHRADALRFARAIVGSPEDAEDAVQAACLAASGALHRFRAVDAFEPWFLAILGNECRMIVRARHYAPRIAPVAVPERIAPETCEEAALEGIDRARVAAAVRRLPERWRWVGALLLERGADYGYIRARQGVSLGAARNLVYRTRECLRAVLAAMDDEEEARWRAD